MVTESRQLQGNSKNQGHTLTAEDAEDAEEVLDPEYGITPVDASTMTVLCLVSFLFRS